MWTNGSAAPTTLFQCNLTGKKYKREKILKPKIDVQKNKRVELWNNGKHKTWLVHRIIGITFLGIPKEKMTINHKDGNRLNNNIDNLEWLTLADNIKHGFKNKLYSTQKEVKITNKKTNETTNFMSLSQASKYIGKNIGYISNNAKKQKYENKNYKWELL